MCVYVCIYTFLNGFIKISMEPVVSKSLKIHRVTRKESFSIFNLFCFWFGIGYSSSSI